MHAATAEALAARRRPRRTFGDLFRAHATVLDGQSHGAGELWMKRLLIGAVVAAGLIGPLQVRADTTVKLGILNDRSGPFSDASGAGSVIAARMAVDDFGALSKGIHVEIVAGDHLNKPDIGSSIARRWYDEEGVDAILDVPISSIALAVATLTREHDKILLTSSSGASDMTGPQCSPNTIQWTYDTWSLANGTARTLVKLGGKTWFFITTDITFVYSLEHDTTLAVEKAGGKVLGSVKSPVYSTDVSAYLLAAQASSANVIGLVERLGSLRNTVRWRGWHWFGDRHAVPALVAAGGGPSSTCPPSLEG